MSKIFEQLLKLRGLDAEFLHPQYDHTADPYILPGMREAVDRIKRAVQDKEKILIYGDYDVDGVTASTVMEDTLKLAGIPQENVDIMLPDRFADGYGMSPRLIKRAQGNKATLVVTVDCGSRNHAIIDELAGGQPIPDERQLAEMSANGGGPQGVDMEMQDGAMSTGLEGLTPETGGEYANPNSML